MFWWGVEEGASGRCPTGSRPTAMGQEGTKDQILEIPGLGPQLFVTVESSGYGDARAQVRVKAGM